MLRTPQHLMATELFNHLAGSGKLASQANDILKMGREMLDKSTDLPRAELDKIIIGTLLLALARNDFKYHSSSSIPKQLNAETYQQITDTFIKPRTSPFYVFNTNNKEDILLIGKMVLEDKTIGFSGTFSQVSEMQEMIAKGLPFMDGQYLEGYGIKSAAAPAELRA